MTLLDLNVWESATTVPQWKEVLADEATKRDVETLIALGLVLLQRVHF